MMVLDMIHTAVFVVMAEVWNVVDHDTLYQHFQSVSQATCVL